MGSKGKFTDGKNNLESKGPFFESKDFESKGKYANKKKEEDIESHGNFFDDRGLKVDPNNPNKNVESKDPIPSKKDDGKPGDIESNGLFFDDRGRKTDKNNVNKMNIESHGNFKGTGNKGDIESKSKYTKGNKGDKDGIESQKL